LTSVERRRCSNEANRRNPLKFAGVPQTPEPTSAVSGPKFIVLRKSAGDIDVYQFFSIVDTCLRCEDIARQRCAMERRWQFWRPVFSASRVQHISRLHCKAPFTRYNLLSKRLSTRLSNRFDNVLYRVYKHSTSCQTRLTTGCTSCQAGCTTGLTTVERTVDVRSTVVRPVVQPD